MHASRQRRRRRLSPVVLVAGGALMTYVLDPAQGRRRRHVARDRAAAFVRRTGRVARRRARWYEGQARGWAIRADLTRREAPVSDDVTLARKVETRLFRASEVPKGDIVVNAANGVVTLRGVAPTPEMISRLKREAGAIRGVEGVQNLLHLPHTPIPAAEGGARGGGGGIGA